MHNPYKAQLSSPESRIGVRILERLLCLCLPCWYQKEPHAPFPALPAIEQRIPRMYAVGGPGNVAE